MAGSTSRSVTPDEQAARAADYRLRDVAIRIKSRTQLVRFLERFHPQARLKVWETLRPYVPEHLRVEPAPWLVKKEHDGQHP